MFFQQLFNLYLRQGFGQFKGVGPPDIFRDVFKQVFYIVYAYFPEHMFSIFFGYSNKVHRSSPGFSKIFRFVYSLNRLYISAIIYVKGPFYNNSFNWFVPDYDR